MFAGSLFTGCNDGYENVADHNKVWSAPVDPVTLTLLDGKYNEVTQTLNASIAQPVDYDIHVSYAVMPEKVAEYNELYSASAIVLPAEYYSFSESQVTIPAGALTSGDAKITFTDLLSLDDTQMYVLPVSISNSNIDVLDSRKTSFYVFRGAALINVVGNMTGTCLVFVNPGQAPQLQGLRQMTFEALVRPDAFTNTLSTLIGIEGTFLIRIGDAGVPSNQIQIATSNGNVTDSAWQLDTGKWTFITITFDLTARQVTVYFDGVQKGSVQGISYSGPINWNVVSNDRACYIGYAYAPDRDFQGDMSEMRVWNYVLTTSEINARNHFYRVEPDSEGLVAYWKFDEGAGNTVHDYANGYDMQVPELYPGQSSSPGSIKWNAVTLP